MNTSCRVLGLVRLSPIIILAFLSLPAFSEIIQMDELDPSQCQVLRKSHEVETERKQLVGPLFRLSLADHQDLSVLKCEMTWSTVIPSSESLQGGELILQGSFHKPVNARATFRWKHKLLGIGQDPMGEVFYEDEGDFVHSLKIQNMTREVKCLPEVKLHSTLLIVLKGLAPLSHEKVELVMEKISVNPIEYIPCETVGE